MTGRAVSAWCSKGLLGDHEIRAPVAPSAAERDPMRPLRSSRSGVVCFRRPPQGGRVRVVRLGVELPQAGEKVSVELEAATRKEPRRGRTPRVDRAELLRRTFAVEVFACMNCGGRRRVLAYVKGAAGVRAIVEHLGLPTKSASLAPARVPPQAAWYRPPILLIRLREAAALTPAGGSVRSRGAR